MSTYQKICVDDKKTIDELRSMITIAVQYQVDAHEFFNAQGSPLTKMELCDKISKVSGGEGAPDLTATDKEKADDRKERDRRIAEFRKAQQKAALEKDAAEKRDAAFKADDRKERDRRIAEFRKAQQKAAEEEDKREIKAELERQKMEEEALKETLTEAGVEVPAPAPVQKGFWQSVAEYTAPFKVFANEKTKQFGELFLKKDKDGNVIKDKDGQTEVSYGKVALASAGVVITGLLAVYGYKYYKEFTKQSNKVQREEDKLFSTISPSDVRERKNLAKYADMDTETLRRSLLSNNSYVNVLLLVAPNGQLRNAEDIKRALVLYVGDGSSSLVSKRTSVKKSVKKSIKKAQKTKGKK
jgi:hypothetical protein